MPSSPATLLAAVIILLLSGGAPAINYLKDSVDVLGTDHSLLFHADRDFSLLMDSTCNLIFYDTEFPIWLSGTSFRGSGCHLRLQNDGELVILDGNGSPVWTNGVAGPPSRYILLMTHNRNAIVYGSPIWSAAADSGDGCGANGILADPTPAVSTPAADNNHLLFGETLGPGESLKLGNLSLVMEKTCNLVLYDSGRSSKPRRLWATHTRRKGRECRLGIEDGGNLVVLDGRRNRTVWESGCRSAAGGRNFALVLLLDRTVALYSRSWWSAVA